MKDDRVTRAKGGDMPSVDRLPPYNQEAEAGVLGCVFMDPACIGRCVEALKAGEVEFYDLRHQTIYKTMVELWDDRDPIDVISVKSRLDAWGSLEQVGGLAYLINLPNIVPSAANLDYYLAQVREAYLKRRMIQVNTASISRIYDYDGLDIDQLLDEVERDVLRVSEARVTAATQNIADVMRGVLAEIEDAYIKKGAITGLGTGFTDLDAITGGLQGGQMIVIAARPGIGKTSLGLNIADYVAIESKLPVGIVSLEMTSRELGKRLVSARARVNLRNVRDGFLAERDYPKITTAFGTIAKAPIYIDDTGGLSVLQVRAKARRWWQQYQIKLLVIDYLQLMNALGGKRRFESRQQEVTDISHGIKELAKELNIPVIVLAQLNRDVEKDKTRPPRLSDLRESGSIESDADLVGFLYNRKNGEEDADEESAYGQEAIGVNLLIAKQRSGPTGIVRLTFLKTWTRFESAAKIVDETSIPQQAQFNTQSDP